MKKLVFALIVFVCCIGFFYDSLAPHALYPAYQFIEGKVSWGYINTQGQFKIVPSYDQAEDFNLSGTAIVTKDDKQGLIDSAGNLIVPFTYDSLQQLDNGYYIASSDGFNTHDLLDPKGKIAFTTSSVLSEENLSEGVIPFCNKEHTRYGFITLEGKVAVNPQFVEASAFSNGKALVVTQDGKHCLIDHSGQIVYTFPYHFVFSLGEGLYYFTHTKSTDAGIVDAHGTVISSNVFCTFDEYKDGYCTGAGSAWGSIVDTHGEITCDKVSNRCYNMGHGTFAIDFVTDSTGCYYLCDAYGNKIIPDAFQELHPIDDTYIAAYTPDKAMLLDFKGQPVFKDKSFHRSAYFQIYNKTVQVKELCQTTLYRTDTKQRLWTSPTSQKIKNVEIKNVLKHYSNCNVAALPYVTTSSQAVASKIQNDVENYMQWYLENTHLIGGYDLGKTVTYNAQTYGDTLEIQVVSDVNQQSPYSCYTLHYHLKTGHSYALEDLFIPDTGYQEYLYTLIDPENHRSKYKLDPDPYSYPTRFIIHPEGLQLEDYSTVSNSKSPKIIPWTQLKPYLNQDSDFWKALDLGKV